MKIMFIDDSAEYLRSVVTAVAGVFKQHQVVIAECHSVDAAVDAIRRMAPDVAFLDHHLTDGDTPDGIMVLDRLGSTSSKIYSSTSDTSARVEYQRRGVTSVRKGDLVAIKAAVNAVAGRI